jgi:hypothetical protein
MTRIMLLMLVLAAAGCAASDPYRRTDVWYPTGANAGNIAAMAVRPHDLIVGRSATGGDAHMAADAVDRIWQGKPKPLTSVATAPSVAAPTPTPTGGSQ